MRGGSDEIYDVTITRARIPINSVVASFMMTENIGMLNNSLCCNYGYEFNFLDELVSNGATSRPLTFVAAGISKSGYLR